MSLIKNQPSWWHAKGVYSSCLSIVNKLIVDLKNIVMKFKNTTRSLTMTCYSKDVNNASKLNMTEGPIII